MDGVDFYVYGHLPIHIGGVTVYITTTHICLAIVMAALIIFAIVANRKIKKAPDESTDRIFKCHRAFSGNP